MPIRTLLSRATTLRRPPHILLLLAMLRHTRVMEVAMVEEGTWLRCLERVQPSPPRRTVHTSFLPMAAMEATVTVTAVTMAVAASLAAITMATAAITANTMEAITDTTTTMAASMAVITDTTATTAASMAVTTAVTMVATMATINTALSFSPCLLNK
uniref:Uncharacterized protein n=1 Tax=Oryza glumipatula TaxID=40148 RepID=A0A0D9ZTI1_9ORYZ